MVIALCVSGGRAKTLKDLAYDNVSVRLGDGYAGWPHCGPFDEIIVTAALGQVPPPLIERQASAFRGISRTQLHEVKMRLIQLRSGVR